MGPGTYCGPIDSSARTPQIFVTAAPTMDTGTQLIFPDLLLIG
jgi:hypothetical protein